MAKKEMYAVWKTYAEEFNPALIMATSKEKAIAKAEDYSKKTTGCIFRCSAKKLAKVPDFPDIFYIP